MAERFSRPTTEDPDDKPGSIATPSASPRRLIGDADRSTVIVAKAIALVLATLAGLWLLNGLRGVLTWIAIAVFFSVALTPPVDLVVRRTKMPRWVATIIVFVVGVGVIIAIGWVLVTPVIDQSTELVDALPRYVQQAQERQGPLGRLIERYNLENWVTENQESIRSSVQNFGASAIDVVRSVFTTLVALITIAFLTILMTIEGPTLLSGALRILTPQQQDRARRLGRESARAITAFVAGNLLVSLIAGIATFITLTLLGVPFAGVLALWIGVADLIPLVGFTLGAIPAVIVGFLQSPTIGLGAVAFLLVYQQVENQIIGPNIMARAVEISPLLVLVSVLIGSEVLGLLGALLALPIAGIIKVVGVDLLQQYRPDLFVNPVDPRPRRRSVIMSLVRRLRTRQAAS